MLDDLWGQGLVNVAGCCDNDDFTSYKAEGYLAARRVQPVNYSNFGLQGFR